MNIVPQNSNLNESPACTLNVVTFQPIVVLVNFLKFVYVMYDEETTLFRKKFFYTRFSFE